MKLSPSIYGANILNLGKDIDLLEQSKVDMIHVDIMDGQFVKGIAFGQLHLQKIKENTTLPLDVHLMVQNPEKIIDQIADIDVDIISIHYESTNQITKCLQMIKAHNIKAGIVLNPATSPEAIKYLIDYIDMVLIMTVNPGEGGQDFHANMIEKIKETKKIIGYRDIDIEVDGSIDEKWALECAKAGATVFVSGSYLFNGDVMENIKTIRENISNIEGTVL